MLWTRHDRTLSITTVYIYMSLFFHVAAVFCLCLVYCCCWVSGTCFVCFGTSWPISYLEASQGKVNVGGCDGWISRSFKFDCFWEVDVAFTWYLQESWKVYGCVSQIWPVSWVISIIISWSADAACGHGAMSLGPPRGSQLGGYVPKYIDYPGTPHLVG